MNLCDYVRYIWDISKVQDVDVGVAYSMFITNIREFEKGKAPIYKGIEALDYAPLHKNYDALMETADEYQEKAKEHYNELCDAYKAGRYQEMAELLK